MTVSKRIHTLKCAHILYSTLPYIFVVVFGFWIVTFAVATSVCIVSASMRPHQRNVNHPQMFRSFYKYFIYAGCLIKCTQSTLAIMKWCHHQWKITLPQHFKNVKTIPFALCCVCILYTICMCRARVYMHCTSHTPTVFVVLLSVGKTLMTIQAKTARTFDEKLWYFSYIEILVSYFRKAITYFQLSFD